MLKNQKLRRLIAVSILFLGLLLLVGLLSVSYTASSAMFLGIILGLLARFWFLLIVNITQKIRQCLRKILNNLLYLTLVFLVFLFSLSLLNFLYITINFMIESPNIKSPNIESPNIGIENYKLTIYLLNNNLDQFRIEELIDLDKEDIINFSRRDVETKSLSTFLSKPQIILNRQITSVNKGLLLKELYIIPLNTNPSECNFKLVKGFEVCYEYNLKSSIELVDFPLGSFYQAQSANNFKVCPYLDTETINWSVPNLIRGIRFAYIPPPYHYLLGFLKPFLKLAYANKWVIVVLGGMLTVMFSPIFKQTINVKATATAENKSMTESSKYDMRGANFPGGFAETNYGKMVETQHNYAAQTNLAEAAEQIQQLLKQLEQTNPSATEAEKLTVVAQAADVIRNNPTLKARVMNALKSGGTEAFKEAIDHPLLNILVAIIQGWIEAE